MFVILRPVLLVLALIPFAAGCARTEEEEGQPPAMADSGITTLQQTDVTPGAGPGVNTGANIGSGAVRPVPGNAIPNSGVAPATATRPAPRVR